MKEIEPVTIWYNGIMITATIFNMTIINDNLKDSATFLYQLISQDQIQLAAGNITMINNNYITFSTSPDSNDYAYTWGAAQLNITLV